jgi:hypothetical protein
LTEQVQHPERPSATLGSGDHAAGHPGTAADLADEAGMIIPKGLVTLEEILRLVREDYPEMTAEELQKHLDALVKAGSILHMVVVCPPPSLDRVM